MKTRLNKVTRRPMPNCLKGVPKSIKEAQKRKVGYFYTRKGRTILLHGRMLDWAPRAIGRYSPKFPDESEVQMHWRLIHKLPDDAVVAFDTAKQEPAVDKIEVGRKPFEVEDYPGKPTPVRPYREDLPWIVVPIGIDAPCKPKGTKWRQIRAWAGECFDHFEKHGKFLSIVALLYLARKLPYPENKWRKILRRLRGLFATEYHHEQSRLAAMIKKSEMREHDDAGAPDGGKRGVRKRKHDKASKPEKKAKERTPAAAPANAKAWRVKTANDGELDRFGNKKGTRTARINAVITTEPKTIREIEEEADAKAASSHLSNLVNRGFVVKSSDKKYTLHPDLEEEAEECREQRSRKPKSRSDDDGGKSGSKKKGLRSKGKGSRRPKPSTGASRKGKRVKSAKRHGR